MKFVTYASNSAQLKRIHDLIYSKNISSLNVEIIVSTTELSRYSITTMDELLELILLNQKLGLSLVLEWDVLLQESLFQKCAELFCRLPLHEFKAVRIQDPGALNLVVEKYPWLKVQLILENGNHNFRGLNRWSEFVGGQLDRLVLSNELSREHLIKYASSLVGKLEVLVFGRILLFYSPRKLLSPLKKEEITRDLKNRNIEAFGTSEESPHAGFPLIENRHGTFMFNVKDLFLVDHLEELRELGISAVRFDLRFDDSIIHLSNFLDLFSKKIEPEMVAQIKIGHIRPMIKGFYNINKTDVLFTKLKNKRIQRLDDNYIGEIVDVERDQQMALLIKSKHLGLALGDEIKFVTPEGKTKVMGLKSMMDTSLILKDKATTNDVVLLPFISGVVAKTQVYLTSSQDVKNN